MPETNSAQTFISPQNIQALRQELEMTAKLPPGSKTIAQAISELLPLIGGCRKRGHTWEAIAKTIQKHIPNLSAVALRKMVWEFDPSLKGSAPKKTVPEPAVAEVSQKSDDRPTPSAKMEASGNGKKAGPTSFQPKAQTRRKTATTRTQKPNGKKPRSS
jgi:hypothetical protein